MGGVTVDIGFDDAVHRQLAEARRLGPTAIDARTGGLIVLRYDEIERLAHDPNAAGLGLALFDLMGIGDGDLRRWYGGIMFTNDGEPHHRLRRLVARAFTPRAVALHRQTAALAAQQAFAELQASAGGDLVGALAEVPITVMCKLLGVPDDDVGDFVRYGDDLSPVFGVMEPEQIDRAQAAIGGLIADVDRMIGRRADDRSDDLISSLLDAEDAGDRLTHEEVVAMVGNLIVAGHDTTVSQIGCTLLTLLRHPRAVDVVRRHTVALADVVTETIRFEPSLGTVPRTLVAPTVIGDVLRDVGTLVLLSTASANREEDVWGDPDVVRPERFADADAPRLLTFGSGAHYCLGAALARMTLEEVVIAFAACDGITPVGDLDEVEWRQVLGRSPSRLDVEIAPVGAGAHA